MCCYESIVNAVIQKIIKEMHQTAEPAERQWARENILDAVIDADNKLVTLEVTSEAVKAEMLAGQISAPLQLALESAYPGCWLAIEVKEPLNLTAFALDKVAH